MFKLFFEPESMFKLDLNLVQNIEYYLQTGDGSSILT